MGWSFSGVNCSFPQYKFLYLSPCPIQEKFGWFLSRNTVLRLQNEIFVTRHKLEIQMLSTTSTKCCVEESREGWYQSIQMNIACWLQKLTMDVSHMAYYPALVLSTSFFSQLRLCLLSQSPFTFEVNFRSVRT